MCQCKKEIKNLDGEIYDCDDFDTAEIEICNNNFLLISLKTNNKDSGYFDLKINYCPFCGEKLNE